jgi:asparagine synthase (glutamine-hydrolysing)
MKTKRALFGWINLDGESLMSDGTEAMLAAAALGLEEVRRVDCPAGVLIAGPEGASVAKDPESGAIAAVLGRPRWLDADYASLARTQGHATAALTAYRRSGENMLRGIAANFALVIVDPHEALAILAIDRGGIERLCYARVGGTLIFSTSARAVAQHPAVGARLSHQALFEYLYCHMVPSPDTAFAGVEKLQPAETLSLRPGNSHRRFYWQLVYPTTDASETDLQRQFRDLARQAVSRQHDSVPIGAFLSGGTDSSTVTGLLGEVSGKAAETFSIGFAAEGFDELDYARITSTHFATRSHEFYVTAEHVAEAMPLIASAYDEPFGNASAVPTYFCAKLAHDCGVGVMLAGDGGDEFFGGNSRYAKQGAFEFYHAVPALLRRALEPVLLNAPFGSALMPVRKAQNYVRQALIPLPDRLETYNFLHRSPLQEVFEPEFLQTIDPARPLALMRDAFFRCASPEPLERMMHLDHKFTLADNDLRKVTRMCEVAGVEVRFPFLDDDLVAFSATLRPSQKVHGNKLRVLFKEALRDFLPSATISKSKHGFGLPFGLWLKEDLALGALANDALERLGRRGIVRPDYLHQLLQQHATSYASYYGVMIWVLVQLELWMQHAA